jgi:vacuolar-type H+-ATPase subunit E/Vma4
MNGIERILEHIRARSITECEDIARAAEIESERLCAEYARAEQEEYWKVVDAGTKEAEQRRESLDELASAEAKKQIDATRKEMLDEAFSLAAAKLLELPGHEYDKLLTRLGIEAGCSPEALVARHRDALSRKVYSALFE